MENNELNVIDLLAHKRISTLEDEVNELKRIVYEQSKKIADLESKNENQENN